MQECHTPALLQPRLHANSKFSEIAHSCFLEQKSTYDKYDFVYPAPSICGCFNFKRKFTGFPPNEIK